MHTCVTFIVNIRYYKAYLLLLLVLLLLLSHKDTLACVSLFCISLALSHTLRERERGRERVHVQCASVSHVLRQIFEKRQHCLNVKILLMITVK